MQDAGREHNSPAGVPILSGKRKQDHETGIACFLGSSAHFGSGICPVDERKDRDQFSRGVSAVHPGLCDIERKQRHVRDRIEQTRAGKGRSNHEELCAADDRRSLKDQR